MRTQIRWWSLCIGIALIATLILLARFIPMFGTRRELARLRAAHVPLSGAELDDYYQHIRPEENGAAVVWEVIKELAPENKKQSEQSMPDSGQPFPPALLALYDPLPNANSNALQKLRSLPDYTKARYPIDLLAGPNTLLPHLAEVKRCADLLRIDAAVSASRGETKSAMADVLAGFALARTLRNEPILISELVRIACASISLKSLERLINEQQVAGPDLARLGAELDQAEADGRTAIHRAFIGERALTSPIFDMDYKQLSGFGTSFSGASPFAGSGALLFYEATGLRDYDFGVFLEMIGSFVDVTTNSYPDLVIRAREAEQRMNDRFSTPRGKLAVLSRMLLPSMSKAAAKEGTLAARLRCARVSLAIEQYRLEHQGELPAVLAFLVPKYLPEIPADPLDGHALEYRLEKNGYKVLSVRATQERNEGVKNATNEVGFIVFRPAAK